MLLYAILCTFFRWPQDWRAKQRFEASPIYIVFWGGLCVMTAIVIGITFIVCVLVILFGGSVEWWAMWVVNYVWEVFVWIMWFAAVMSCNPVEQHGIFAKSAINFVNCLVPTKLS